MGRRCPLTEETARKLGSLTGAVDQWFASSLCRDEKSLLAVLLGSDPHEMSLGLVQFSADKLFAESNHQIWHGQAP